MAPGKWTRSSAAGVRFPGIFPPVAIGEKLLVGRRCREQHPPSAHAPSSSVPRRVLRASLRRSRATSQPAPPRTAPGRPRSTGIGLPLGEAAWRRTCPRYQDDVELIVLPAAKHPTRPTEPTSRTSGRLAAEAHAAQQRRARQVQSAEQARGYRGFAGVSHPGRAKERNMSPSDLKPPGDVAIRDLV